MIVKSNGWHSPPMVVVVLSVLVLLAAADTASAKTQLNLTGHFGGQVDSTGANVCSSIETCQEGIEGAAAGWFEFPQAVAVNQETQDVYVTDLAQRVQELSSSGSFIRAWGAGVISGGVSGTGTLTSGSSVVTEVKTSSGAFMRGQTITGTGIPAGTIIQEFGLGDELKLSNNVTVSASSVTLMVAAGVGKKAVNEVQKLTVSATSGGFALGFLSPGPGSEFSETGARGRAKPTLKSSLLLGVVTETGQFESGDLLEFTTIPSLLPTGTTITEVGSAGSEMLTVSNEATATKIAAKPFVATNFPYNATAAQIQSKLESLPSIGAGNISVTGGPGDETGSKPYLIEFKGRYADTNMNPLTTTTAYLAGGSPSSTAVVETTQEGGSAFEVCEVASACQTGVPLGLGGAIDGSQGIAVDNTCFEEKLVEPTCKATDPANGDVYVLDTVNHRIDRYDSNGKFLLTFGGEVNTVKAAEFHEAGNPHGITESEENVCTAAEVCQAGKEKAYPGDVGGFFSGWPEGNMIAVGGLKHLVYVGLEGQVEAFSSEGHQEPEFTLPLTAATNPAFPESGQVTGLTVDKSGSVYLDESHRIGSNNNSSAPDGAYEFGFNKASKTYEKLASFDTTAQDVTGLALDPVGRLTISEEVSEGSWQGVLFRPFGEKQPMSTIKLANVAAPGLDGSELAYDDTTHQLYATILSLKNTGHEVNSFTPAITPEVITGASGSVLPTSAVLEGEVNAENVTATSKFAYGRCEPAPKTCKVSPYNEEIVTTPPSETGITYKPVTASLSKLYPNQPYHYKLVASSAEGASEGNEAEFKTPAIAPEAKLTEVPFSRTESAVFKGSLNPENASTKYQFEYGRCSKPEPECGECLANKTCLEVRLTPVIVSSIYGEVGTTSEVEGLSPASAYHVRLVAVNVAGKVTSAQETGFKTAPPVIPEAVTGLPSEVTSSSAIITGNVNPDGQPAAYIFELGIDNGANTVFTTVSEGPTGSGVGMVGERLAVTGLLPETKYLYRIRIESGYSKAGDKVNGVPVEFATAGMPVRAPSPNVLPMLPPPKVCFPGQCTPPPCKAGFKRNKQGKCVKVVKKARRRKKTRPSKRHRK